MIYAVVFFAFVGLLAVFGLAGILLAWAEKNLGSNPMAQYVVWAFAVIGLVTLFGGIGWVAAGYLYHHGF